MIERVSREQLSEIVRQKIFALMREMEDADWQAQDVALEIEKVVRRQWLDKARALRQAQTALPSKISDGNEG